MVGEDKHMPTINIHFNAITNKKADVDGTMDEKRHCSKIKNDHVVKALHQPCLPPWPKPLDIQGITESEKFYDDGSDMHNKSSLLQNVRNVCSLSEMVDVPPSSASWSMSNNHYHPIIPQIQKDLCLIRTDWFKAALKWYSVAAFVIFLMYCYWSCCLIFVILSSVHIPLISVSLLQFNKVTLFHLPNPFLIIFQLFTVFQLCQILTEGLGGNIVAKVIFQKLQKPYVVQQMIASQKLSKILNQTYNKKHLFLKKLLLLFTMINVAQLPQGTSALRCYTDIDAVKHNSLDCGLNTGCVKIYIDSEELLYREQTKKGYGYGYKPGEIINGN